MKLKRFKHLVRIIPSKYNELDITLVDVNFRHKDVAAFVHRERDEDFLCLKGLYDECVRNKDVKKTK